VKFADGSSVVSILKTTHHTIDGQQVTMRVYHPDTKSSTSTENIRSLMSLTPDNPMTSTDVQRTKTIEQLVQENLALKYELGNVHRTLTEAQAYSKIAYETFQALREKFGNSSSMLIVELVYCCYLFSV
jgi:hypothetical protein